MFVSSKSNQRPAGRSLRGVRATLLPTLLVAGAALLGPGGAFRAAAQFPVLPENEPIVGSKLPSLGVYQVTVTDPKMLILMNPGTAPNYAALTFRYGGWDPIGGTMTSPLLSDPDTQIAVSGAHQRETAVGNQLYFVNGVPPGTGPGVQVGQTLGGHIKDVILSYNDYWYPVPGFDFEQFYAPGLGRDEVLTEIQRFTLTPRSICNSNNLPQLPPPGSLNNLTVKAGYENTYDPGTVVNRSIGMVQSVAAPQPVPTTADFPAESFFNIYVEIALPSIPGSVSEFAFPSGGAILINDQPLCVVGSIPALNSQGAPSTLPPSVVYTHTASSALQWAVDLKFRDTGPINLNTGLPFYNAGDILGTLVLAGHGTGLDPCAKGPGVTAFVNTVLGTNGQSAPRATVGRFFPTDAFPSPTSAFGSVPGTNYGGFSNDEVTYSNGTTVLHARSFTIGNLINPIALPPANSSATYSNTSVVVTLETSTDGLYFVPAQATGMVQVLIINTNPTAGVVTSYHTELLSLNVSGITGSGSKFALRKSSNKSSFGKHLVQNVSGGHKVGGYIDATMDYGFNGTLFRSPSRPIRLEERTITVDCGAAAASLGITVSGSIATVSWVNGSYRLQGRVSLAPSDSWVNLPVTSPYPFALPAPYHYFRLVCP